MPYEATKYEEAVQAARRRYYAEIRPRYLRAFYDEYALMLARLITDVDAGILTPERAAGIARSIRRRMDELSRVVSATLDEGVRAVIDDMLQAHRDGMIAEALAEHVPATGPASVQMAAALAMDLDIAPVAVVEMLFVRRGLATGDGLAATFRTLMNRRITHLAPAVDRFLSYGIATGMHWQKGRMGLVKIMAEADPKMMEAIRRVEGRTGRLMVSALKAEIETPEEMQALRRLLYDTRRIYVTEFNNSHFEADRFAAEKSPAVDLVRWRISTRHLSGSWAPDICDVFAHMDTYGFGPGVYHPGQAPTHPHPHCQCNLVRIYRPPEDWDKPKRTPGTPALAQITPEQVKRLMESVHTRAPKPHTLTPTYIKRQQELAYGIIARTSTNPKPQARATRKAA